MSFKPNFPPSLTRKYGDQTSEDKPKSKEDFKKMKELEEARKSAVLPAMKDEEGHDINPHIPQYIMQAPWYFGAMHPTLKHQRPQTEKPDPDAMKGSNVFNDWYKRGTPEICNKVVKYVDGACENCGATTHKKKDCLERPRKVTAKIAGIAFAADDYKQANISLGYDAKRDRWNGYDPIEHSRLIDEFQNLEEARKLVKAKRLDDKINEAFKKPKEMQGPELLNEDEEDEEKYGDDIDMPGQKFDSKQRQSIRNLRIREDTAKYLYNLDPNSAYYDPKTRSMRENPFEHSGKHESEVPFAGDNFIRFDGDAIELTNQQVFAWEMHNKLGLDVHLQADPTRMELLTKKVAEAKTKVESSARDEILDKYGGREHMENVPKELLMGQWESYAEYTPTGRIIKGAEKPTVKSRFEEDVFINNHTTVYGSYWHNGQWGYKCCGSLIKEAYCVGKKDTDNTTVADVEHPKSSSNTSRRTLHIMRSDDENIDSGEKEVVNGEVLSNMEEDKNERGVNSKDHLDRIEKAKLEAIRQLEIAIAEKRRENIRLKRAKKRSHRKKSVKNKKKKTFAHESSSSFESDEDEQTEKKVQKAMKREKERLKRVDELMRMDERLRPYNSVKSGIDSELNAPTEEEMEAYYRLRKNFDDPLSHFS